MPEAGAALSGTVRDRAGQPVAGATVRFAYRDNLFHDSGSLATTDAAGSFTAQGLLPGYYRLEVEGTGMAGWENTVSTVDPPLDVVLTRTRGVRFELVDEVGLPWDFAYLFGTNGRGYSSRSIDGTGRHRVEVPETETDIQIDVDDADSSMGKKHLDWPPEGDLDLGRIVLVEDLGY